jgi:uncharacterized protein (TIGR03000 family)
MVVEVPADAKLYVDDQLMKTTSERRAFTTPVLDPGETYYYIVRAEVVRDGQKISRTKRVTLRAGEEARAIFAELRAPAVAGSVASVKP